MATAENGKLMTQRELRMQRLRNRLAENPNLLEEHTAGANSGIKSMKDQQSKRQARVCGIVLDKYVTKMMRKGSEVDTTRVDMVVMSPTAEYPKSISMEQKVKKKDGSTTIIVHYKIDKENDVVELVVDSASDNFMKNKAALAQAGFECDECHPRVIKIVPFQRVSLNFDGKCEEIPLLSLVTFNMSASAWVATEPDKENKTKIVASRAYTNGRNITLRKALSGDEWVALVAKYPSLVARGFPRFGALASANNNWQPDHKRKLADQMFIVPFPRSLDFKIQMLNLDEDGAGVDVTMLLDEQRKNTYSKKKPMSKEGDPDLPALRFKANMFTHKSEDEWLNNQTELHQFTTDFWDTRGFGVTDVVAWPLLAQQVVKNTDIVVAMRPQLDTSSNVTINNKTTDELGPKDPRTQYFMKTLAYRVGLGAFLLRDGIPVSRELVKRWIETKYSYFGTPPEGVVYSKGEDGTAVRTISEMGYDLALGFVRSEAGMNAKYRVLCVSPPNRATSELLRDFVTPDPETGLSIEDEYIKKGFPLLGALMDPDFDQRNPNATRDAFFGPASSDSDHQINMGADHPLLVRTASPLLSMRDKIPCSDGQNRLFFYIFAIDEKRVMEKNVCDEFKAALGKVAKGERLMMVGNSGVKLAIEAAPINEHGKRSRDEQATEQEPSPKKARTEEEREEGEESAPEEGEESAQESGASETMRF